MEGLSEGQCVPLSLSLFSRRGPGQLICQGPSWPEHIPGAVLIVSPVTAALSPPFVCDDGPAKPVPGTVISGRGGHGGV